MRRNRLAAGAAMTMAAALVLAACNGDADPGDDDPTEDETTEENGEDGEGSSDASGAITVAWNQTFYEYNNDSATGNAAANAIILYMMNDGFRYFDDELNVVRNESFGTYNDEPEELDNGGIALDFVLSDDTNWYGANSEPVPIDAADLLLAWAAHSGHVNTTDDIDAIEESVASDLDEEYAEFLDEDGEWVEDSEDEQAAYETEFQERVDEILISDDEVYFNSVSPSISLIEEVPEVIEDGKGVRIEYSVPFVDWDQTFGVGVPAHVVAMRALDIEDPMEAKERLITAIQDNVVEDLAPIAAFWNTGFQFGDTLPDDDQLYLSSGAYLMSDFAYNQFTSLTANPDYTGDHPAQIEDITVQIIAEPTAAVQALQNQEVQLIQPQLDPDGMSALLDLEGQVETFVEEGPTYEHLTLVLNNGGPFDPETYGGDEETAIAVRQAFLKLIPREEIVDTQLRTFSPDHDIRNSWTTVPGAPAYDMITEQSGMAELYPPETDLEGAQQLLEEAGVETPIPVRIISDNTNARRATEFRLIQESAEREGLFEVVDEMTPDWGSILFSWFPGPAEGFDAGLFGWQSTSTAVGGVSANYLEVDAGGSNNFSGYSNDEVTALLQRLDTETDVDVQGEILAEVEEHLVDDGFGVTIFQHEMAGGYDPRLSGVDPIALSPTIFWNYWEWSWDDE